MAGEINKQELKTPLYEIANHWEEQVYSPREDSFLLLDAIEEQIPIITGVNPTHILEIGSGSGIIIVALASLYKKCICMAIDINPNACRATLKTAEKNGVFVDMIHGDLVSCLRLNHQIDVLIINPPYVPCEKEEVKDMIDHAWAGDKDGRAIINRLFSDLHRLMSQRCIGFIVAIEENKPDEMCAILSGMSFRTEIIKRKNFGGERLSIIQFMRLTNPGLSQN